MTVTYETKDLSEIPFPVYFSFLALPGFNIKRLQSFGLGGEYELFTGKADIYSGKGPFNSPTLLMGPFSGFRGP